MGPRAYILFVSRSYRRKQPWKVGSNCFVGFTSYGVKDQWPISRTFGRSAPRPAEFCAFGTPDPHLRKYVQRSSLQSLALRSFTTLVSSVVAPSLGNRPPFLLPNLLHQSPPPMAQKTRTSCLNPYPRSLQFNRNPPYPIYPLV